MCAPAADIRASSARLRRQAGYTALEFLAAFTLLILFLTASLAAVGVAIRSDRQAGFATTATMLARTKLAAAGIDFPLRPGAVTGAFDNGFVWRAEVRNHRAAATGDRSRVRAFWVQVTVADPGSGRSLSLASVELRRAAPP